MLEVERSDAPRKVRKRPGPRREEMRAGPGLPLNNPKFEMMARDIAGGMSEWAAFLAAGYSPKSNSGYHREITRRSDFIARVEELREKFNEGSKISLAYLQERLLAFTTADIGNFLEKRPYSEKLRVKDLTALPPELRACVSRVTIDKNGTLNFELHDKTKAIAELIKTVAPRKVELSGPDGGPMLLDALLHSENLAKLEDSEIEALKVIASKIVGPVAAETAEAANDDGS